MARVSDVADLSEGTLDQKGCTRVRTIQLKSSGSFCGPSRAAQMGRPILLLPCVSLPLMRRTVWHSIWWEDGPGGLPSSHECGRRRGVAASAGAPDLRGCLALK